MPENDPNKTYEHLKSCVAKVITMQEQKKNLAEREALLTAKEQRRDLRLQLQQRLRSMLQKTKVNPNLMSTLIRPQRQSEAKVSRHQTPKANVLEK
jgi:hypothetical protein